MRRNRKSGVGVAGRTQCIAVRRWNRGVLVGLTSLAVGLHPAGAGLRPFTTLRPVVRLTDRPPATCLGRIATIVGTPGPNVLHGTDGPDVIAALGGSDVVHGRGGDDVVCGDAGSDILLGDLGNDTLSGGPGDVGVFGRQGEDTELGGPGDDLVDGGRGDDTADGGGGADACIEVGTWIGCEQHPRISGNG
jgi:hypothetical protein